MRPCAHPDVEVVQMKRLAFLPLFALLAFTACDDDDDPSGNEDVALVRIFNASPEAANDSASNPIQEGLPLKPERTIRFTTDVGTWMSLDVSPDGQTIVFDHLGDLFTVPIAGGKATPIT